MLVRITSPGALAIPLLMLGRICQGLSGAFIMPASLALISQDVPERRRPSNAK